MLLSAPLRKRYQRLGAGFCQSAPIEQSARIAAAAVLQRNVERKKEVEQEAADARHAAIMDRLRTERLQRKNDPRYLASKGIVSCVKDTVSMVLSMKKISNS